MNTEDKQLHELTEAELEDLQTWFRDLHGIIEGDSIRSVINENRDWMTTVAAFKAREIAIANEEKANLA